MKIDAKFREINEDLNTNFQETAAVFPVSFQENAQKLHATYQRNCKPFKANLAEDEMRMEAKFSETQVIGSGSGKDGEDGGYYIPSVDTLGNLKWNPSKASMPQVSSTNIKGKDGKPGADGKDGYTPVKGIDYFDGLPGVDGKDGYTPIKGVDYFDGLPGVDGKPGDPGKDGVDGYTPIKGVDYFDGLPGKDGTDGQDGLPGRDGLDGITPHIGANGNWWIGETDTGIPATGATGTDGQPGKDGYSPVRGTDYWTPEDIQSMVTEAVNGVLAKKSTILETAYPVGAIYMATVSTSPQTLFGFGTWEQIQDRFLLASGSSYSAGSTGGEATHTLTVDEMPSHDHAAKGWAAVVDGSGKYITLGGNGKSRDYSTDPVGGGQAHNNMPPYLAVYVWKRTA